MKKLIFLLPWLVVMIVVAQDFNQPEEREWTQAEYRSSKDTGSVRETTLSSNLTDDIDVNGKYVSIYTVEIPTDVTCGDGFSYTIQVHNQGLENVQTIEVETTIADNTYKSEISLGELAPDSYMFVSVNGPKMAYEELCKMTTSIVKVDGKENYFAGESKTWFLTSYSGGFPQNVVLEEATGTWCGFCPRGILMCEYIRENYGDRIFPIAIHSGDDMQIDEYNDYIIDYANGYPSAMVNRSERWSVGIVPADRLYAKIKDEKNYARVKLKANLIDQTLKIQAETEFALDTELEHRLSFVVVEDRVGPYYQVNNYDQVNACMGIWDVAGPIVHCYFNDVARIIKTYEGIEDSLPHNITAGTIYDYETEIELLNVNSPSCRVIAMIINPISGEIINSDLITVYPEDFAHFDKNELNLVVGETSTLIPTIAGYDGDVSTWVWSSSNENVAKVDASGNVVGCGWGNAIITASCPQGTAQCDITVAWLGRLSVLEGVFYRLTGENTCALSYNQAFSYPVSYGMESLTVPSEIEMYGKAYEVTEIEQSALSGCTKINEIELPSSVKCIGSYALSGCSSLSCVDLNEGLRELGDNVFGNCSALKEISFPGSIEKIGENLFKDTPLTLFKISRTTPPDLKGELFEDDSQYGICELVVPQESVHLYKGHPIYGKFSHITGNDSRVEGVNQENLLCNVYSLGGMLVAEGASPEELSGNLLPGVYVLRYSNGTIRKITVK